MAVLYETPSFGTRHERRLPSDGSMNAADYLLASGADGSVAVETWNEQITYGELREAVARTAAVWRARGLEPGDRVLIFAPDSIGWVIAYLGAIWAGGVAVGLNSRLFERELSVILGETGARFVYADSESAARLGHVEQSPARPAVVTKAELAAEGSRTEPIGPMERSEDDVALWLYTSGTTGVPKAVMHAHRLFRCGKEFSGEVLGVGAGAKIYASSKLFFAYALGNGLSAALGLGATLVLDSEWPTAERVAAVVERHSPTVLFSVPTLYLKMLQAGVAPRLDSVEHFVSAGEALPPKVAREWKEATGVMPVNGYGATETTILVLYCPDESGLLVQTPNVEIRVPEPPPEPDTPHRLWLRHQCIAVGYFERPEAERDAFSEGWFSPNDLFLPRADARWEFRGRSDDLVKISGQWVSTVDVEQSLLAACGESVAELASISFENANGLASIAVFAVPAPGCEKAAATRLQDGIEALPKFRRPREIRWLEELPKSATGKLQRRVLREQYLDEGVSS
jgi:acyl-coenzyme A synthetase/AMP-(fatty) acid ligase